MRRRVAVPVLVVSAVILSAPFAVSSLTNSITFQSSVIDQNSMPVDYDDFKPDECRRITIDTLVNSNDSNSAVGTSSNDLVLGKASTTSFDGGAGNDCLVASTSGTATLIGGDGDDICIGNGETTFDDSCETQVRRPSTTSTTSV